MDNKDDLKLVRVGKDVPTGFEVVETGDAIDLSDEIIDALALKAIKEGTIQLARKKQGDEEQKGGITFQKVPLIDSGRMATVDEVRANLEQVRGLLNQWTIALLDGGKLNGSGYGSTVEEGDFSLQAEESVIGEKIIVIETEATKEAPVLFNQLEPVFSHDEKYDAYQEDAPIDFGQQYDVTAGQSFTMCARVRADRNEARQGGRVLAKRAGSDGWEFVVPRYNGPISFYGNGQHLNIGNTRVDDGVLHHVAIVYDADIGSMTAYLDGTQDGAKPMHPLHPCDTQLWVGARGGNEDKFIDGEFDHVRVYDRALSHAQLKAMAERELLLPFIAGESLCQEEMKETVEGKSTSSATPDEPKKEANLGDFIGAMGGLMAAFAPGEEGQQIQKEVNQMAAMFGASPDTNKKDESKKTMPATVSFIFRPKQKAFLVEIAGSFNAWSKSAMTKDGGHWRVSLQMKPGRHQYKYIVDGEGQNDEDLPKTEDKQGGWNNVINVDYEDDYKKCPNGHPMESTKIGDDPERPNTEYNYWNCNICEDAGMDNWKIQKGDQRYQCSRCDYDLHEGCYNNTEAVVTSFGRAAVSQKNSLGTFIRSPQLQKAQAINRFPIYKKVNGNDVQLLFLDVEDSKDSRICRWRISPETSETNEGEKTYGDALKHGTDLNVEDPDEDILPPKTGWIYKRVYDDDSWTWFKEPTLEVLLKGARKTNIMFVKSSGGSIPPNAVPGGKDENGETLYVGRAMHEGSLIPGKLQPSAGVVYVSCGGKEYAMDEYEVLVQEGNVDNLRWIKYFHQFQRLSEESIGALVCGCEDTGSPLYVARVSVGEQLIIGKAGIEEKGWIPLNGEEQEIIDTSNMEVLCCNELAVKEYNSDGVLSTKKAPGEADQDEEDGNMIQCAQQ